MLALAALVATGAPSLLAQEKTEPAESEKEQEEDVIVMSPFEVRADQDKGYAATSSLAGSRLNTELRDIAASVQVVTAEFVKDIGATNLQKMLLYTTNTEVAGTGGNFYGGDAWDKGRARGMLIEPDGSTRIRGLNEADRTREYFPSDIPMDWYNMTRADINRGSNAILFGLGSPAGIINNTLKVPNVTKNAYLGEVIFGSYGSFRRMVDLDQTIIPGQLGVRVVGLDDDARFRQDFTYNRDKRLYGALRWQPKITRGIYTQVDAKVEWGNINANRPVSGTPSDFISSWFGGANRLRIPNDVYWTAPGFVEDLYASQTIGGQLWDNHPVSFFSDANNSAVGMTDSVDAMLLRGNHNVDGGGWGSWVGMLNPNWVGHSAHPKNSKAYYANNPTVASAIDAYEQSTGKTFRGFGNGMWSTQMIVSGPLADLMRDQNLIGPNKSEFNNFRNINLSFTQSYLDGRLGLNFAYDKQHYSAGYTNLMEGLWGMNMISIDVNETLRGSTIANPNFGRPFTIGEGRGGIFETDRENWRAHVFGVLKATDFLKRGWLTNILGEHTFTGVRSSQHHEVFDRYYALYRWQPDYLKTVDNWNGYATWRGIHYLGGSLLNTASMDAITGVTGVRSNQTPPMTQDVWHDAQGTWKTGSFSLLSAEDNIDKLYDGVGQGYDDTQSKVFVWQGKMLNNVIVPIFGWREDSYTRWNKPSNKIVRDPAYNFILPYGSAWNYDGVTPLRVKTQRRSWSLAVHGKELMQLFKAPMPKGMDISFLYNDSSSFRPSEVAVDIYGRPEDLPTGKTKDLSVLVSAFNDRISLRVTKFKTTQHNTSFSGAQPDFGWAKANLARSMDGMMWEVGAWANGDPTKRVQPTPEWLVNRWMFGDNYDKSIANTPLPANWQSDPNIMNQPLRIRASAVPGSATYVAEGTINPDTDRPYVAPPLTADEVAYRTEWYKARSDAEWSRPVDQAFWSSMAYTRNYTATWGGFWEIDGWVRPPNQRNLNDIESTGLEFELTANPTPNWRLMFNASKVEAVRANVLTSWDAYIAANKAFYFDGGYDVGDAPASNYWNFKGYYDIAQTPGGESLGTGGRLGTVFNDSIYTQYYQAKATTNQAVAELRKWHWNLTTNYTFTRGFLKNVGVGGAVRWQDKSTIGYYPTYNPIANAWVIDLSKPIKGPSETNYDAWISYERRLTEKINWSIQLNVNNLFAKKSMIPITANPDGTIAQVRIPGDTTWSLRNTFSF
ncbi:MAG TPA: TonB-dependent receptor plug domain-containing protein [Opitutaceae bacterium]|nr:TonB-dependent receptor plug domain-containing protein [Opitutaceae bacterium]